MDKVMVTNTPSLEHAIEGFEKVLYFTHDYVLLAPSKGDVLQAAARNNPSHECSRREKSRGQAVRGGVSD